MAQRNQYNPRGQSIDSTIRDASPQPEHGGPRGNVDDGGSERQAILHDIERSASPSTSTWSSEIPETGQSNATQSVNFTAPQRRDSPGVPSSESDSLSRSHDTPRSQSNQSGQFRWSYQRVASMSNLDIGTPLPEHHLQEDFETLTDRQDFIPSHRRDDRPRIPTADELRGLPVVAHILSPKPKEGLENIIIVLHDHSGNEHLLHDFAERNLRPRGTACLLLRGVSAVPGKEDSYQWEDNVDTFLRASRLILNDVISALLISKCNFPARKIILFGQGEGAMAALTTFSAWERVEFGGVICIGGELPSHIEPSGETKSNTAVLLLGGALGMTTPVAKHRIQQNFSYVDCDLLEGKDDALPRSKQQLKTLRDFFSHRLHEEEWTKPAVITFDGGGIRGYGSLLILQALMNKIGKEEKRLDSNTESSFYPCMYKPMRNRVEEQSIHATHGPTEIQDPEASNIPVETPIIGLPDSSLFLPCHYFQYAGGTSTGGLISIMISRFRMTVDDCLQEYRALGSDVFGKPRPFTMKTLLWDKFDYQRLRQAIEDVTTRHCEDPRVTTKFPSPKDLCRTTVVAYNDKGTSEDPYLIRTFETFPPRTPGGLIRRTSSFKILDVRNAGPPQDMDIPLVGRATTAAPGYFRHLTTKIGDTVLRFKDGGFGCNNPSWEVYKDVKALLANGSKDMGPFVSIGTGFSDVFLFPQKQGRLRHRWAELRAATKGLPTRTKGAHESMIHAAYPDPNQTKFHYSRFDGGRALGTIAMDEWVPSDRTGLAIFTGKHKHSGRDTLKTMEDAIMLYLAEKVVQEELDECAKILVQRRRRQTRDQSKWDRFASASWYICPYTRCKERRHDTLELYKGHVRRFHPHEASQKQLDAEAQHARRCWLYRDNHHLRNNNNGITSGSSNAQVGSNGPDRLGINPASTFGSIEV